MNESELRALVRDAIARHTAGQGGAAAARKASGLFDRLEPHASHGMFKLATGAEADGPCLIEPAVQCNHCGYCKSLGH
jgi:hypothetical protein